MKSSLIGICLVLGGVAVVGLLAFFLRPWQADVTEETPTSIAGGGTHAAQRTATTNLPNAMQNIPFKIVLKIPEKTNPPSPLDAYPSLVAHLVNTSQKSEKIFYNDLRQPSWLELTGPDGKKVTPDDKRAIMEYNPTIQCEEFEELPPQGERFLGSVSFRHTDKGYSGEWGTYEFKNLPPGAYTARAVWASEKDSCQNDSGATAKQLPTKLSDIWLGEVTSNSLTITLP